jgi:hypothetical protein
MNDSSKSKGKPRQPTLGELLDSALQSVGLTIPMTEEQVGRAEVEINEAAVRLPERLTDPYRVLDEQSSLSPSMPLAPQDVDSGVVAELARAAREGSAIPASVEAAMRRDRDAAERESVHGIDESQI